ncbi:hypothetical protein ACIGEI_27565, partial [Pseudomonas sp. NPDC078863]
TLETYYSSQVLSPLTVLEKLRSRRPGGALAGCMAWTWKISENAGQSRPTNRAYHIQERQLT